MAGKMILALAIALLCCCSRAMAASYTVGDELGWIDPSKANVSYADWALKNRYHVGDSLVFKYASDAHTVLKVNRQDFESCHNSNSMAAYKDGESIIHLSSAGPHWFICGEPSHCAQGQKFGIMVVERRGRRRAASPSPAPAPSSGGDEIMPAPVQASDEAGSPTASPRGAPAIAPAAGGAAAMGSSTSSLLMLLSVIAALLCSV